MTETPDRPSSVQDGLSDDVSRAVDAAIANAALEGIEIPDDERALIEAHQRGELSHEDFLAAARHIAHRKAVTDDD